MPPSSLYRRFIADTERDITDYYVVIARRVAWGVEVMPAICTYRLVIIWPTLKWFLRLHALVDHLHV